MEFVKRLFGGDDERSEMRPQVRRRELSSDEQAVERYRYLLRTAPPETIEEAHAEAFAKLTPEQRGLVLAELTRTLTPAERASGAYDHEDPRTLARLATRTEMRQPGALERTWTGMPATAGAGGLGIGSPLMGNFMGAFAGVMLGSMVADAFLGNAGFDPGLADAGGDAGAGELAGMEDLGGDAFGGGDLGGMTDLGGGFGDFGDFGGDF